MPAAEPETEPETEPAVPHFEHFAEMSKRVEVDDCNNGFRFKCVCGKVIAVDNHGMGIEDLERDAECERCGRKFELWTETVRYVGIEQTEGPGEEYRERVITARKKKFFDQQNRKITEFTTPSP